MPVPRRGQGGTLFVIKFLFVFLALVLALVDLCLILWGGEGAFPQWIRALLVGAALGLVVLVMREKREG